MLAHAHSHDCGDWRFGSFRPRSLANLKDAGITITDEMPALGMLVVPLGMRVIRTVLCTLIRIFWVRSAQAMLTDQHLAMIRGASGAAELIKCAHCCRERLCGASSVFHPVVLCCVATR